MNWYAYVGNDPVNMADPTGKWGVLSLVGGVAGIALDFALQVHTEGYDNVDYTQVAVAGAAGMAGANLGKLAVQVGRAYVAGAASSGALADTAGATLIAGTIAAEGGAVIEAASEVANGYIDYAQGDRLTLPTINDVVNGAEKGFVSSGIAGGVGSGGSLLKVADEISEVISQVSSKATELF